MSNSRFGRVSSSSPNSYWRSGVTGCDHLCAKGGDERGLIPNLDRPAEPVESVLETKIETFQADAAYGDSGGGTVNVITKSGTNQLHGTLSWFNQNSALAATPYFTNSATTSL